MPIRVEVALRKAVTDTQGNKTAHKIKNELGLTVDQVRIIRIYTVDGLSQAQVDQAIEAGALHDPVLHTAQTAPAATDFDWIIEVGFRPGVTDNEGRTARETLRTVLGERSADIAVYTSTQYLISGDLSPAQVEHIAKDLLANELIQRFQIADRDAWAASPGFPARTVAVTGEASSTVDIVDLSSMDDAALMKLSRENILALNLEEMRCIRDYYASPEVVAHRKAKNLPAAPTDAELECLAQTWSEHCKHKIFSSRISYENLENGTKAEINSLYKTYIQGSTKQLRQRMGKDDFCLSVFKDNAGVIRFSEDINVCIKVETHNSPSALDPYGGALTGIVGVNRDPMGTGMGANLLCNTNVFCFASPFHDDELPPRLLHPRRVFEGVREGVEHGGNKSGIPTVNGAIVFHERFLGKPLVFCGTIGTMPATVAGHPSYEKKALPGDRIIMTGGRIGKDGIHGATFSSEELHEGSPATAVQIGDPITQRRMYDFLMRARDLGLYNAITDNGAGGLSSSVGEMAQDCGGCDMDLAKAPLKYDGLRPWEILVSEAQERMTLAVPPSKLQAFMELAEEMNVEASDLGCFTDSGYLHVRYNDRIVTDLDMQFLHDGCPQMKLRAAWRQPQVCCGCETPHPKVTDHQDFLQTMLGRLNICSREYVIRQYDHEVQGGSVIKPLIGARNDGPADAAVIRPQLGSDKALVVANGICPKLSDLDTYWMMAGAIDEAVRNAVATGGDIRHMAGVDNFCWCDPVQSEKTPDGEYKLAQLVRANQALAHFCLAYGVPCISGKDSMKNDYTGGGTKISIPPTVLFSVMGVINDCNRTMTSDFKRPDENVYVLGLTKNELGGSEYADALGVCGSVPQVDAVSARIRYERMHEAITTGLVSAAHDVSDGGLAVAVAEMALAGRIGADIDVDKIPALDCPLPEQRLYSESASRFVVTVPEGRRGAFEALFADDFMAAIGRTTSDEKLTLRAGSAILANASVEDLATAWKKTLDF
ncbi:phosphoribosylformylglycinamidine synthase subunit II [Desulfomicrobium norvegicum]|uniref:Phosphoribosylformylglycinamidine synthase subunit PurL n=1 Tax=Desulfomicrobium norvegicum (strain DSM 1741 / NCIMB 8310) TaxID=52561 RepID=A0A8G2C0T6_DESNO|nr:AIR synthase-related protein [Desulfomicrobium norvegicum]SFL41760.1 phosphoribosylformylglycinamidine synthase subunit II [Desulfomicrobium norvegicum]